MPLPKAKDLRELGTDEIARRIRSNKEETVALKLQRVTGALENPARFRTLRRENARLVTIAHEKKSKA